MISKGLFTKVLIYNVLQKVLFKAVFLQGSTKSSTFAPSNEKCVLL